MKRMKQFLRTFLISMLLCMIFSSNVFAAPDSNSVPTIETTEGAEVGLQGVKMQELDAIDIDKLSAYRFENQGNMSDTIKEPLQVPENALNRRDAWAVADPVFVGNGTLDEAYDIYLVDLPEKQIAFLKLESANENLMALLYEVDNGIIGEYTGYGVWANAGDAYVPLGDIEPTTYAIVIMSSTDIATSDYKLMWNSSNPSGAEYILHKTDDLSRVILAYDMNTIRSNGENILEGLKWEESVTWSMPLGYSARDMRITLSDVTGSSVNPVSGLYLAAFSSTAPYSTPNALLVEVNRGHWVYFNSYYKNDTGAVTHVMDWYDPSGLKTPRTFGEGEYDFAFGPNYIVIDLDKFQVCDFVSYFNYNYLYGGREKTITNPIQVY